MSTFSPTGKHDPACPDCKGSGERDSGGTHPWGEAAMMPCDCDLQLKGPVIDLYHVSLKVIREAYFTAFAPLDPNLMANDIDWHIIEIIKAAPTDPKADQIRRQSIGAAALDDLVSHATNLLSAMDSRIRLAQAQDANAVRLLERISERPEGPTDSNESYWKREREVLAHMIHQARFARGEPTSDAP